MMNYFEFFLRCRVHPNEIHLNFLGGRVPYDKLL